MKNYLYPLIAVHKDGGTNIVLYSSDDVKAFIRKHGRFHSHHKNYSYDAGNRITYVVWNDWIVRDNAGKIVVYEDFTPIYDYSRYYAARMKRIRDAAEKGLPIPGTGCWKAGYKQNAPGKKNSGAGKRGRDTVKYNYDVKEYELPFKSRGRKYIDPWY